MLGQARGILIIFGSVPRGIQKPPTPCAAISTRSPAHPPSPPNPPSSVPLAHPLTPAGPRSYHLVLYPLTTYLAELLPEGARDSSRTELFYEDLDKLPPGALRCAVGGLCCTLRGLFCVLLLYAAVLCTQGPCPSRLISS